MESVNVSIEMESNTSIHCLNTQQSTDRVVHVFPQIVLITEMIVGLPGSILALWIFCFRLKVWKTHIFFLFNLLLADFLLLASVPFRIDTHLRGGDWVFGRLWCSINLFMLSVNRSASIAFMTVVALDRYFKVVHPHHCINRISLIQARWLSALMWITVILFQIPFLTTDTLHTNGNVSLCHTFLSYKVTPGAMKVHYVAFTAEFFLPWLLLLFCSFRIASHLRQREMDKQKRVRRAIQAVFVISAVFTFCFMPSVITGLLGLCFKAYHPLDCKSYNRIIRLFTLSIGLTYLKSALDPIIYIFSSAMFCAALKKSFSFRRRRQMEGVTQH
ncbi:hydroxycarboxylic acid receptor 2-like [Salarias fasciatus]|uniref:hydroxycarboxylic acid receptor 2-like n=1 Tax=Salarias fasciatus TaxID=181472 RepID=UPI001176E757|nr:hydroxycarboxylic acid receptor 2-like [Salarias fasciatus]